MTKDPVFDANPALKFYFKTSDGQAFYKEENAKLHISSAKLKDKKIDKVTKPLTVEKKSEGLSAKDLIEKIKDAKSIEAVDALVDENEKRTTVLDAVKKQKETLEENKSE